MVHCFLSLFRLIDSLGLFSLDWEYSCHCVCCSCLGQAVGVVNPCLEPCFLSSSVTVFASIVTSRCWMKISLYCCRKHSLSLFFDGCSMVTSSFGKYAGGIV